MSTRHYCDGCGDETARNYVTERYVQERVIDGTKVKAEIIVGINGTWNGGDVCFKCLCVVLDLPALKNVTP